MREGGENIVNHKLKPETQETEAVTFKNESITEADFKTFLDALSRGASHETACRYAGRSEHGMRSYARRAEERGQRVMRARAEWTMFHLDRLAVKDDNGSGASARGRNSLGALASVDKRYRKEVHVGGTQINNTLVLADPRPSGLIGNPNRYALPAGEPMAQADTTITDTPAAKEPTPAPVPMPVSAKKVRPIL